MKSRELKCARVRATMGRRSYSRSYRKTCRSRTKRAISLRKIKGNVVNIARDQDNDNPQPATVLQRTYEELDVSVISSKNQDDPIVEATTSASTSNPTEITSQSTPERHRMNSYNAWETDKDLNWIMNERLHDEYASPENSEISGNRIFNVDAMSRMIRLAEQHTRRCTAGELVLAKEVRNGVSSVMTYKCNTCDRTYSFGTDEQLPIMGSRNNVALVWATNAIGSTFDHNQKFLSILNIPTMSKDMFYDIQEKLLDE